MCWDMPIQLIDEGISGVLARTTQNPQGSPRTRSRPTLLSDMGSANTEAPECQVDRPNEQGQVRERYQFISEAIRPWTAPGKRTEWALLPLRSEARCRLAGTNLVAGTSAIWRLYVRWIGSGLPTTRPLAQINATASGRIDYGSQSTVAVGTTIADRPPHRSARRVYAYGSYRG
jgi:hypothetical protein